MSTPKGDALLPSTAFEGTPRRKGLCAGLRPVKALLCGVAIWVFLNAVGLTPIPGCIHDVLGSDNSWKAEEQCPQVSPIVPQKNAELWNLLGGTFGSDAFKARAVEWLGGAVRVP